MDINGGKIKVGEKKLQHLTKVTASHRSTEVPVQPPSVQRPSPPAVQPPISTSRSAAVTKMGMTPEVEELDYEESEDELDEIGCSRNARQQQGRFSEIQKRK
ncbi:hypothetical protein B9Z55_028587 [Caenorhabditis nigoni]|uniref:Uncharacterized protein n=1 Tax=Caenorhabditis nigoni TaxID=1611254 RepID=A0A2G5SAZ1_9PELO|nr:hypothetical protein B9Z55_028587 [Caenorhabditis nigoni]